jgi:hypothetical protein
MKHERNSFVQVHMYSIIIIHVFICRYIAALLPDVSISMSILFQVINAFCSSCSSDLMSTIKPSKMTIKIRTDPFCSMFYSCFTRSIAVSSIPQNMEIESLDREHLEK